MNIDRHLIKGLKSNDEIKIREAFNHVYNKYYKLVFFCILTLNINKQDAEELMNDTFIKVFNNIAGLDENKNLKFYLTTTAKNLSINFLNKNRPEVVEFQEYMHFSTINYQDDIINQLKMILDDKELNIIVLHVIYGYSFKEISEKFTMSINTITSTYRRAIKKAKKLKEKII